MMKYSLNHDWKFDNWGYAYLAGLLQTFSLVLIEVVNCAAILTHFEIIDITMKFMTLLIISTFS